MANVLLGEVEKHKGWPIRLSIASVVVLSMLLLSVVILVLGFYGAQQDAVVTATRTASDAGTLVSERARRMLEPAEATLRQLTFDPITSATTLDERLQRLHVLSEELAFNELITSIYVGYANGDFLLVRPLDRPEIRQRFAAPPMANFLVQAMTTTARGQRQGEFLYFTANRKLLERRAQPDYRFDPRTRPWFQGTLNTVASVLSPPYVFFTTQQIGITLSQKSRDGQAVLGIDVVLNDLADSLDKLRMTPNTRIALVDAQNRVLAYPDMARVLQQDDGGFVFKTLPQLQEPSLNALPAALDDTAGAVLYTVDGEEWLGVALPFDVWRATGLRLLLAQPSDEVLGELRRRRNHLIGLIVGMVVLLLPLGWVSGATIGRSLDGLSLRTQRIGRFDFAHAPSPDSWVREVNTLSGALDSMGNTIETFLRLSQTMATEPHVERMLDAVLQELLQATRCTSAVVYLWREERQAMVRSVAVGQAVAVFEPEVAWPQPAGAAEPGQDHHLKLELRGRTGELQGLLVLAHNGDEAFHQAAFLGFAQRLSGMLAVSIETRQLIEGQKQLLDAVIRLMADAIDAKSPYTGGHCERVPELATQMVDQLQSEQSGPYAAFRLSEDERYEFYMGAWLHDCGKVTSPEHIVDKATKLELIYDRIHEVRMRFEVLWRDARIHCLEQLAAGVAADTAQAELAARQQRLQDDFAFVARCNVGGESMADKDVARLQTVAQQTWLRHFDDRLGLGVEELQRLQRVRPQAPALPVAEALLADRPEHTVPWDGRHPPVQKDDPRNHFGFDMALPPCKQNMGELHNLTVRRGTLTAEDRFKINEHIVQTYMMLHKLPWPRHMRRVPEIASTHHEKLDGTGYPRRLAATALSIPDRVMALADVFEALTAVDRPYKAPKTLSDSLKIMARMCQEGHLDGDLFRHFLRNGAWREFGQRCLKAEQCDAVDVAALEAMLTPMPA